MTTLEELYKTINDLNLQGISLPALEEDLKIKEEELIYTEAVYKIKEALSILAPLRKDVAFLVCHKFGSPLQVKVEDGAGSVVGYSVDKNVEHQESKVVDEEQSYTPRPVRIRVGQKKTVRKDNSHPISISHNSKCEIPVGYSVFLHGFTVPADYTDFISMNIILPKDSTWSSMDVVLYVNNRRFDVSLHRAVRHNKSGDNYYYQILWSGNGKIQDTMKSLFPAIYNYVMGEKRKNPKAKVNIPDNIYRSLILSSAGRKNEFNLNNKELLI